MSATLPATGTFRPTSSPSSAGAFPSEAIRRQIPSLRNREIFAAAVMGKSHEKVALEFGLTQPRVTQIVEQVRDWTAQTLGGEDYGYTEIQQLRLAHGTLRIQLDGWMRMMMQQWHASCAEKNGRTTFVGAAARLALQMARLAGVDVSGKTARMKAEQQEQEEAQQRAEAAKKPLWKNESESPAQLESQTCSPAASPAQDNLCIPEPPRVAASEQPSNDEKNPYGIEPAALLKQQLGERASFPAVSRAERPIPKFLGKKARKRLLEMRRREARDESLAAVG